ncbi:hypothetical protein N9934_03590 [Desulfosarcina sp.]|nr:hypothetical protein [Desulfosarcina sp.]
MNKLVIFLVLLLIVPIISAQEIPDDKIDEIEDFSVLDDNELKYILEEKQGLLTDEQLMTLSQQQIEDNLHLIGDLSRLDPTDVAVSMNSNHRVGYFSAESSCSVSEEGILKSKSSQLDLNELTSGLFLHIESNGVILVNGVNGHIADVNGGYYEDGTLQLPEGVLLSGRTTCLSVDCTKKLYVGDLLFSKNHISAKKGVDLAWDGIEVSSVENGFEIYQNKRDYKSGEGHKVYFHEDGFEIDSKKSANFLLSVDEKDDLGSVSGNFFQIFLVDEGELKYEYNREENGERIIPKLEYYTEEGELKIFNSNVEFKMDADDFITNNNGLPETPTIPLEIHTTSLEKRDAVMRVSSWNTYAVLRGDERNNPVVYNEFNLPVSYLLDDNKLLTIEDLEKKWPTININTKGEISPYHIKFIDFMLEKNPDYLEFLKNNPHMKNLALTNTNALGSAFTGDDGTLSKEELEEKYHVVSRIQEFAIRIDLSDVYPYIESSFDKHNDRELDPYGVFIHEFEHALDKQVRLDEKNKDIIYDTLSDNYYRMYYKARHNNELQSDKEFLDSYKKIYALKYSNSPTEGDLEVNPYSSEFDIWNNMGDVINIIQESGAESLEAYNKASDRFCKITGLPSFYSAFNFREISSTYREEPIDRRKSIVTGKSYGDETFSDKQREIYKKLTQLEFDSGKMDAEEYSYVMGLDCGDCGSYKCKEYTALCCQNYPTVPGCTSGVGSAVKVN